jgi:hypothetical protein
MKIQEGKWPSVSDSMENSVVVDRKAVKILRPVRPNHESAINVHEPSMCHIADSIFFEVVHEEVSNHR